jgi:SAM-dependent methyltransferase
MSDLHANTFDSFARFYDADYRDYVDDLDAIAELAAEAGGPVLELGCGTGRVLVPLAATGHAITGVDGSPALLALARQKVAAAGLERQVSLIRADLRTMSLPRQDYGFAFCTSNTLMHLTTAADQESALKQAWRHLHPDGLLLVDLFNPDVQRLTAVDGLMELADQWADAQSGAQVLKWSVRTVDWATQLQDTLFIYEENWPDGRSARTLCPFTLRFLWRSEGELLLRAGGFAIEAVWGDFDGSDYTNASDHLIFIARRDGS